MKPTAEMKEQGNDMLDSRYVIDGISCKLTPRQMLSGQESSGGSGEIIVDESVDPAPQGSGLSREHLFEYIYKVLPLCKDKGEIPAFCPESATLTKICTCLSALIWRKGHFRLEDLCLGLDWEWDFSQTGNAAAFYRSVEAVCGFTDSIDVRISRYSLTHSNSCSIEADATLDTDCCNLPHLKAEDEFSVSEVKSPYLSEGRTCLEQVSEDKNNWIIYIPFDTCACNLGGSALSEATGIPCGIAPDLSDPDYFIDCYEVVREFSEDGIFVSGIDIGRGGLGAALARLCGPDRGMDIDLGSVLSLDKSGDILKILFSEIPGVLVEIRDSDFDYLDAEMLLQDVAYYPIGHPGKAGLRISSKDNPGIAGILISLMDNRAPEGED